MSRLKQFVRDEYHMLVLMPALYVPVVLITGYWQVLVIFAGAELYSQSWHENRHKDEHPRTPVGHVGWRVLGAAIALAGALLLRWTR